jgi:hypothetical protein
MSLTGDPKRRRIQAKSHGAFSKPRPKPEILQSGLKEFLSLG